MCLKFYILYYRTYGNVNNVEKNPELYIWRPSGSAASEVVDFGRRESCAFRGGWSLPSATEKVYRVVKDHRKLGVS